MAQTLAQGEDGVVLRMSGISKAFPGVQALDAADLEVRRGEVHGLVGENGAGKSTIIKVLAGVYGRDAGHIEIDGDRVEHLTPAIVHDHGVRFIHQELHLVPYFTVAESVFMTQEVAGPFGLRRREMRERAERFLEESLGARLDGSALIRDLGPAERKLVQIARALIDGEARIVVFDEPTAPLAAAEVDRVFAAIDGLKRAGIAILYVSHYLAEITAICDRVTVFRNGLDVGVVEDIGAASGRELIELMIGRELGEMFPERSTPARGGAALEVRGFSDGVRFHDVSLTVHRGEIVGLAGLLGSGREELIDAIIGLRRRRAGHVEVDGHQVRVHSPADALSRGMALVPRDRRNDGLVLDMDVSDNINLATLDEVASFGWLSGEDALARARDLVERMDVRPGDPEIVTRLLSGGNQQKVVLGRWLAADADVFLLDEPTVGVDVGAKAEIYRLLDELAAAGAGLLVSSNDSTELLGICDRIIVLVRGRIVADVPSTELTLDRLVELTTGSAPDAAPPASATHPREPDGEGR
jgi:ribose transport system ATP-binding protein